MLSDPNVSGDDPDNRDFLTGARDFLTGVSVDSEIEVLETDDAIRVVTPNRTVRARSVVQRTILSIPVVAFIGAGWAHRWITEDGFIYLRVVHQITAGHGPVFNVGERVEAYTGTMWVGVLAIADLLTPFRLEWIAVFLGLGFGALGVAMATAGAQRLWSATTERPEGDTAADEAGKPGPLFVPFGAMVFPNDRQPLDPADYGTRLSRTGRLGAGRARLPWHQAHHCRRRLADVPVAVRVELPSGVSRIQ